MRDHGAMTERTDLITASRVDLTLILLPLIGRWEAAWTLAANDVPLEVAARVLALPGARRDMRSVELIAARSAL